jgi:hypothetical protein
VRGSSLRLLAWATYLWSINKLTFACTGCGVDWRLNGRRVEQGLPLNQWLLSVCQ